MRVVVECANKYRAALILEGKMVALVTADVGIAWDEGLHRPIAASVATMAGIRHTVYASKGGIGTSGWVLVAFFAGVHVRLIGAKSHWNQSVMHSGTDWKVSLTGGPLGQRTEELTLTQSVKKLLTPPGRFHIGSWIPVVYLQGQWLPLPDTNSALLPGTWPAHAVPLLALPPPEFW